MLLELRIKNFVLIDEQVIEFSDGFNVLSGETGAGKSIILQALAILLGAKPKGTIHRDESQDSVVEAVFDLTKLPADALQELPDILDTKELLISRSINPSGRARAYLNGRLATAAMLEDLADKLVNICGQNQHVRLLDAKHHLSILDAFADITPESERYRSAFSAFREAELELGRVRDLEAKQSSRLIELEDLIGELETLKLKAGLRSELESAVSRSASAEKLLAIASSVGEVFSSGGDGITARLKALRSRIHELAKIDPAYGEVAEGLFETAHAGVADLEISLNTYFSKIEIDEDALESMRERLSALARAERKHRTDDAGLLEKLSQAKQEMVSFGSRPSIDVLQHTVERAKTEAQALAKTLTEKRRRAFEKLKKQVEKGLKDLNMAGATLHAQFVTRELTLHGSEDFEFLIATNAGEKPKQLKQVASGGELSRITLVLKEALQDKTGVNVLVFDEVDTGISGGVARAVGERLKSLSTHSQVICITHLPQVASLADNHLLVEKAQGKRAETRLRKLDASERIEEIARMLSGHTVTPAARQSAKELISSSVSSRT